MIEKDSRNLHGLKKNIQLDGPWKIWFGRGRGVD